MPGDRLPTEQQLATAHGVSRTVVREAIHQLKSQGLVRSRQGSGVFVTEPPAYRKLAFGPQLLESMEAVVQVVELRRVVEGEMAALAAQRATAAQCKALMRALAAIDTATSSGQLGVDEDLAFHRAIGAATGNPQFVRLLAVLEEHLRDQMSVTKGNEAKHVDMMAAVRREHRAIVDAIAARNPKAARAAAIEHHINGEHRLIAVGAIKPKRAARRADPEAAAMPRFAANLSMLYNEHAFLDRFGAAARDGFAAVEYLFPYEFAAADLRRAWLTTACSRCCSTRRPATGPAASAAWPACPARGRVQARRRARARLRAGAEVPARAPDGGPGARRRRPCGTACHLPRNLAWAASQSRDITFLIEPINTRDIPRFFLNRQDHAH